MLFDFRPVSPIDEMMERLDTPVEAANGRRNIPLPRVIANGGGRVSPLKQKSNSPPLKKCRICFQTDILEDPRDLALGKEPRRRSLFSLPWTSSSKQQTVYRLDDGFISPCACKGSMAWVHKICLRGVAA